MLRFLQKRIECKERAFQKKRPYSYKENPSPYKPSKKSYVLNGVKPRSESMTSTTVLHTASQNILTCVICDSSELCSEYVGYSNVQLETWEVLCMPGTKTCHKILQDKDSVVCKLWRQVPPSHM